MHEDNERRRRRSETNESSSQGIRCGSSSYSTSASKHIYYSLPSSSSSSSSSPSFPSSCSSSSPFFLFFSLSLCRRTGERCSHVPLSTSSFFLLDKWHANREASINHLIACCYNVFHQDKRNPIDYFSLSLSPYEASVALALHSASPSDSHRSIEEKRLRIQTNEKTLLFFLNWSMRASRTVGDWTKLSSISIVD